MNVILVSLKHPEETRFIPKDKIGVMMLGRVIHEYKILTEGGRTIPWPHEWDCIKIQKYFDEYFGGVK